MNVVLFAALAYAGICTLVFLFQERLLFFPRSSNTDAAAQLQSWRQSVAIGEEKLAGWLIPARNPSAAPLVFYFGGNAEDISVTGTDLSTQADANFVLMNYRGYGGSGGRPSQTALQADAVLVYDEMIQRAPHNGKRVVFGRSLGSSVGVYLASRRRIDAAVLVTPFDSMRSIASRHFPWLPVSLLLKHPFDSAALAPRLKIPALFLLAERDEVVPLDHSHALADRWGGPARLVTIKGARHNTIGWEREFWTPVRQLLQSL